MSTPLSPHFTLEEFLHGSLEPRHVPDDVRAHLTELCVTILEPLRAHFGIGVFVTSGWRPAAYNAARGGVQDSDHTTGRAADIYLSGTADASWQANTLAAFEWIREHLAGVYGQLILEDHRKALQRDTKLWVHVAIPGPKHHGGEDDPNRLLVSHAPKQYQPWKEEPLA